MPSINHPAAAPQPLAHARELLLWNQHMDKVYLSDIPAARRALEQLQVDFAVLEEA